MSKHQTVGYIRVSDIAQNTERQLTDVPMDKVFSEKVSGKNRNRPKLAEAIDYCREGDTLVVHSIDRLARNVGDLLQIVQELTNKGVGVKFIKQNLHFTGKDSAMDKMMLIMLGGFAEFERETSRERQAEGIAVAKARGVYTGRKPTLSDDQAAELKARKAAGESVTALAKEYGLSRQSVYRYAAA